MFSDTNLHLQASQPSTTTRSTTNISEPFRSNKKTSGLVLTSAQIARRAAIEDAFAALDISSPGSTEQTSRFSSQSKGASTTQPIVHPPQAPFDHMYGPTFARLLVGRL